MKLLTDLEIDSALQDVRQQYSVISHPEIQYLLPACKVELAETGGTGWFALLEILLREVCAFRKEHGDNAPAVAERALRRAYELPELAKARKDLAALTERVSGLEEAATARQEQHRKLFNAVEVAEKGLAALHNNRAELVKEIKMRKQAWDDAITSSYRSDGDRAIDIMGQVLRFEAVLPQIDAKIEEQTAAVKSASKALAEFEQTLK